MLGWRSGRVINSEKVKKQREEDREKRKEELRVLIELKAKEEKSQEELHAAEELLVINENEYAEKRRQYPFWNKVWYSTTTLIITIAVFVVTFLVAEYIMSKLLTNNSTIFFTNLEFSLPLSLGATLIPIIISITINNFRLQEKNAEINAIYSEIANLRSKITLLQQKMLSQRKQYLQD